MFQSLPKVIPINELKNTAQISKTCNESPVPIIVTKNGYSDMVMMSVSLYEQLIAKMQVAALVNEASENFDKNGMAVDGEAFMSEMRGRYAK